MKKKPTILKRISLIAVAVLAAPFLVSFIVRVPIPFSDRQPETEYTILTEESSDIAPSRVIDAAEAFWTPPGTHWPEPSAVVERDTFWWVKFKKRSPVYLRYGIPLQEREKPGVFTVAVDKADLSCSSAMAR